jgi:transcriptional regulator with XRE-family HTH domain
MSFDFELSPKEEAGSEFVAIVGDKLQRALIRRKKSEKFTQQQLAEKLGVDRSRVNRCFSGSNNLTISTLAEIVWALDGRIVFDIVEDAADPQGSNFHVVESTHANEPQANVSAEWSRISQTKALQPNSSFGASNWK